CKTVHRIIGSHPGIRLSPAERQLLAQRGPSELTRELFLPSSAPSTRKLLIFEMAVAFEGEHVLRHSAIHARRCDRAWGWNADLCGDDFSASHLHRSARDRRVSHPNAAAAQTINRTKMFHVKHFGTIG
ncbi:MAG: hypothetical protein ACREQT_06610, partial [Candidatus Binataceae bacterium]